MSNAVLKGNASGTGTVTLETPNTNSDYTIALPSDNGTMVYANSSGNVGVGTTTPAAVTGFTTNRKVLQVTGNGWAQIRLGGSSGTMIDHDDDGTTVTTIRNLYGASNASALTRIQSGYITLNTGTSYTERMRITKDGDFLMAPDYRTDPRGRVDISAPGGTISPTACLAMSRWGDAGTMVNFFPTHSSTTSIGNIYNSGLTSTQYNTSSDYRLKENIAPMTGALAKVALLKPCTYTWKSTGNDSQGFIAHELQEVIPDAVCGEKDAVDADGNIIAQGVDTSFLVATLTAAIQELNAKVEAQAAEIQALKGVA